MHACISTIYKCYVLERWVSPDYASYKVVVVSPTEASLTAVLRETSETKALMASVHDPISS